MLLLLFQLNGYTCALDAADIEEILPCPALRPLSGVPPAVRGALNYRGRLITVIDPSILLNGPPARNLLSTRLTILCPLQPSSDPLALILESATDMRKIEPSDIVPLTIGEAPGMPALGQVLLGEEETIQLIDPRDLIARMKV